MPSPEPGNLEAVVIRPAGDQDHAALRRLFRESRLTGNVPENDTGADIERLHEAYLDDGDRSGFWVADYEGQIVGMIGVQRVSDNAAEIRRLRVEEAYRRQGIGRRLMELAVNFCQRHGYLKVILDVRIERAPAIAMFESFGFQLGRTRDVEGRKLLDFYLDLYRDPG